MANFKYKARDKFGKSISGVMSGDDKSAVAQNLGSAGYIPISIEEAKESKWLGQAGAIFDRITLEDLTIFTRQLLTLQKSGVALLASLSTLE
ncbi:MAG: type II secretion system F family protein, partial [Candidatus Omnitrophica bacterium]|nr:type II secretion system F family protein [Candidatus Omnitrophota bacterium]